MLFFGPIGVLGVGLLLTHGVDTAWLLIALFSGCMSVAVLNLNNLRDHASDALAGKHTVVVRLGFPRAKLYHLAVLGVGWSALAYFFNTTQAEGVWRGTMWYALLALLHARHAVDVWRCTDPSTLDPELNASPCPPSSSRCSCSWIKLWAHERANPWPPAPVLRGLKMAVLEHPWCSKCPP